MDIFENGNQTMKIIAWPTHSGRKINPYTSLLYEQIEKSKNLEVDEFKNKTALLNKYDIAHVHWPEAMLIRQTNTLVAYLYVIKFVFSISVSKWRGAKFVWTVHNLKPHESKFPRLRKYFSSWLTNAVDGVIVLSQSTVELLKKNHPALLEKPIAVIPHGHYKSCYPNTTNRQESRSKLGITNSETVLLFIGQIREYKNVLTLIQCFRELGKENIRLLIAGSPDSTSLKQEIEANSEGDFRINNYLEFIDDNEIQFFLNAADLVVLPYTEILNSGSAILALSFNKPVLVPQKGSMSELKDIIGAKWVHTYENSLSSEALLEAINWLHQEDHSSLISLEKLDWNKIAEDTVQFYQKILNTP